MQLMDAAFTRRHRLLWCSQEGSSPLHCAARYGHAACVALLLAAGANKDAQDSVRSALVPTRFCQYCLPSVL